MDNFNKIETHASNMKKENNELSFYSKELVDNTRDLINRIFPSEHEMKDQSQVDDMAINKELFRTCILAILKDMSKEDKTRFMENDVDFKNILKISVEKTSFVGDIKNFIKDRIDSLSVEDIFNQSKVVDKLDLLNLDGDVVKMSEDLYSSIKNNEDALKAHSYMNVTSQ